MSTAPNACDFQTAEVGPCGPKAFPPTSKPQRTTIDVAWRLNLLFTRKNDGLGMRTSPEAAKHLYGPMAAGRITLSLVRLPLFACQDGLTMLGRGNRTESGEHMAMKRAARTWMRGKGALDAAEEVPGYHGQFDVFSVSADWIVECGNTNIGKLSEAVADESGPRFTLIPWQEVQNPDGSPRRLLAVDFHWKPDLTAEVADAKWAAMRRAAAALDFSRLSLPPTTEGA